MHHDGVAKTARKVDLQVRGVPIELRRRVGRRAASKGLSISKYVIEVLDGDAGRPLTIDEWLAEVEESLGPPRPQPGPALSNTLREIRDALDRGEEP